ncbi:hypothetical protein EYZ11_003058 [Aspergillus tanneri]|uniref:GPI anchored cell wall protein n=1 Tax=Aspergillus tanneri TaxID=1220188 RepID=A0A4S3JPX0_9EURO|nr:uncharacterized protein ATNIH1004_005149 [Aspergillus tanneri]KAA8649254.1 hypothetical protein ATNIH1004_005149 [Aspergillus tanneri]THC97470.1 hypothetical protein EYZ11_003058 [Aspergillus tanneri]
MLSLFYSSLVAALATTISAETTTIQGFNAGRETLTLHSAQASIVNVNADATTYALACQSGAPLTECPLPTPVTVTEGTSTYTISAIFATITKGVDIKFTFIQDCDITSSTQGASCSVSMGAKFKAGDMETSTGSSTITSLGSDDIFYMPLTVTAGADKLNAPQATQTPGVAAHNAAVGGAAAAAVAGAALGFL